jgi:hypothetical protein
MMIASQSIYPDHNFTLDTRACQVPTTISTGSVACALSMC